MEKLDIKISVKSLLRFAIPSVLAVLFMDIYTTVDGVFISRIVGTDALSAVNIVTPFLTFMLAIGTMFGSGGNALVAKKIGEKKQKEARSDFSLIVLISFTAGVIAVILMYLFLEKFIYLAGSDNILYPYCEEYALALIPFLPSIVFSILFQIFFVAEGKSHYSLILSIVGGILNTLLDYILIKIYGMGLYGAATVTGIGYTVQALFGFLYFSLVRSSGLYIVKPNFDIFVIFKSCSNGVSEMVTFLALSVVTLLLNNIVMGISGSDGVASITIILYMQMLMSSVFIGYSIGTSPLVSYNYGRKDYNRIKKIVKISLVIISVFSVLMFVISQIFAGEMIAVFSPKGSPVYNIALYGYHIFAFCFLFSGFNIYASSLYSSF